MHNQITIKQIEIELSQKRTNAKYYASVIWFSGLVLLIIALGVFFVMFVRLIAISKQAGQLADLQAERGDLDVQSYNEQKSAIINEKSSSLIIATLTDEKDNIKALTSGNTEGLMLLYMVNCLICVLFMVQALLLMLSSSPIL